MTAPDKHPMLEAAQESLARVFAQRAAMAPGVEMKGIPESEVEHVMAVEICLQQLDTYTRNFSAAVDLFDESYRQFVACLGSAERDARDFERHRARMAIAGRDGAMSIHHFAISANAVRSNLGKCGSLGQRIDHPELRATLKAFDQALPGASSMRHAVAHAAERLKDSKAIRRHAPPVNIVVSDGFVGSRFTTTFEGKILEYEVAPATLAVLEETRDRIWKLFR